MIMSKCSRLQQLSKIGLRVALVTAPLWLLTAPLAADWYDGRPPYTHPNEAASQLDPVPGIDPRCGFGECLPPRHHPEGPPGPILPPTLGHATLLVDCGARHGAPRHGVFDSVNEAAEHAPPNATIFILPPGEGRTCVETVHIKRPVTLATYGTSERAVIQSEDGQPCLVADLPLGDQLIIDGVRFVARSHDQPCIAVEAGRVMMRNSSVDARGSAWAFNVRESAELIVESSRVETDASAIHARRAKVAIHNLDIDIDARNLPAALELGRTDCTNRGGGTIHGSVALALECSDGVVDRVNIIGGAIGIVASAGTRGLQITDAKITKADTGVLLLPGQLGTVDLERTTVTRAIHGIVVAPGAESQITGSVITDSRIAGISVFGASTLISNNKIVGAGDGIALLSEVTFPPLINTLVFPPEGSVPANWQVDNFDGPVVENNLIANVRHAGVRIDSRVNGNEQPLYGKLIGNTIYARSPAVCIDDRHNDDPVRVRANTCNKEWLVWPF
jgi:hypothetical protein